jgi:antirestriction protein ArdC
MERKRTSEGQRRLTAIEHAKSAERENVKVKKAKKCNSNQFGLNKELRSRAEKQIVQWLRCRRMSERAAIMAFYSAEKVQDVLTLLNSRSDCCRGAGIEEEKDGAADDHMAFASPNVEGQIEEEQDFDGEGICF